ncbi:(deoxy)nucleoside triphosphate pyrophosphohydrolase [Clostridium polynesiense]|uniref:(deoxy)nucleoside triphosphate pyrophosphohydrolase n=1 Tax=Clostridium polynesiense TaxID=1325933 RepID=UPI00058E483C|nr:(deoxy)nucleoside triphosphate pyrophosphohydrolase [Clostridium polynesiense]
MKKSIRVVGAVIENEYGEILCALRSTKMAMPNLWEFPGGKIEKDESIQEAIVREIKEELKCDIQFIEVFNDNTHEYDTFIINLITAKCRITKGNPTASEHDKLLWLSKKNLLSLKWAPADIPAVNQILKDL